MICKIKTGFIIENKTLKFIFYTYILFLTPNIFDVANNNSNNDNIVQIACILKMRFEVLFWCLFFRYCPRGRESLSHNYLSPLVSEEQIEFKT